MNIFEEELTSKEVQSLSLADAVNPILHHGLPLAVWRRPGTGEILLCFSLNNKTDIDKCNLDTLGSGYLFCPFETNDTHKNHFIKSDVIIRFKADQSCTIEIASGTPQERVESILNLSKEKKETFSFHLPKATNGKTDSSEEDYVKLVTKAIRDIKDGKMSKVVPARIKSINLKDGFSLLKFFTQLNITYPDAFIYLTSIPDTGTWIGATPENLISVDKENRFKATALAGTQAFTEDMDLADAAWRQKEIEEQAMVSRYIINCFKRIRLREFEEIGPKTSKAGNLVHLKTDFLVHLDEVNFQTLPTVMLELLHPTSATCGMPKEESLQFLHENENFDRAYFSGFTGPNNIDGETNIFVNLRCMQLTGENSANLYAGAGVTIDSRPEKEWKETEMKIDTLLKVIHKV